MPSSVEPDVVVEQRILEAAQQLPPSGAVSGWAALRMAGGGFFDGVAPDGRTPLRVRLVVPPGRNLRARALTSVGRERVEVGEVVLRHGVPCLDALRATFDEARNSSSFRDAVVAVDMSLAAGLVRLDEFVAYASARRGWPGARVARAAGRLADPRSLSPAETRMRLIWRLDAGLPSTRSNWPIADLEDRRLGRPDLLCDELGVFGEYDGADHRSRARHRADVAREDLFRRAGLEGFVVVGSDLEDTRLVVERMTAAVIRAREANRPRRWMIAHDPGPP